MDKMPMVYEVALDIACESHADECCPHELELCDWKKCRRCRNPKKNAVHYDPKQDIACWKRHYLEKAEERIATAGFSGPTDGRVRDREMERES